MISNRKLNNTFRGCSLFSLILGMILLSKPAWSDEDPIGYDPEKSKPVGGRSERTLKLERLPNETSENRSLLEFEFGNTSFGSFFLRNSYYSFQYPNEMQSVFVGMSWERPLAEFGGQWGLRAQVQYSNYGADLKLATLSNVNVRIHYVPLSTGIIYRGSWSSWMRRWLYPIASVGGGQFLHFQSGSLDGVQAQGNHWMAYYSFGLRHRLAWMGLENSLLGIGYSRVFLKNDSDFLLEGGEQLSLKVATEL